MKTTIREYLAHIKVVFKLLGSSQKKIPYLIISFVFLGALDIIGIGLIGPVLAIFLDYESYQAKFKFLEDISLSNVILIACSILVAVFLFRIIAGLFINSFVLKVAFDRQIYLRSKLISSITEQEYLSRLRKTSGQFTTLILGYCTDYTSSVISLLRTAAEVISILFITILLIVTDLKLFLLATAMSGTIVMISVFFFSKKFVAYGEIKNDGLTAFTDAVTDTVNGIKEIKILKISNFFRARVVEGAKKAAFAETKLYLFSIIPRYFIEFLLVLIVSISLTYSVIVNDDISNVLASLSIFLVAAIRLLPSLNAVFINLNIVGIEKDSIVRLNEELSIIKDEEEKDNFVNSIEANKKEYFKEFEEILLQNIHFSYGEKKIFQSLDLLINKGEFIGLLGRSGEGKTTLVDLILGIHTPDQGQILIDGISIHENIDSWRENIAYLPQEPFLINSSIEENIAIGEDITKDNKQAIYNCINKAGLSNIYKNFSIKNSKKIGERGLLLSGGQRQRVSLARAFYKNKNIFIFDESTSALDKESSERISQEIANIALKERATVIMISHNESTLKYCTKRLYLEDGVIKEI